MQDNRSALDQENSFFTWYKSRPRSARLFPVDYSLEEFSSALNQDKRNVKKNLLLHPYVADSLFDLLFSDSAPQNASNSSVIRQTRTQGIPPIPLEAAPCAIRLLTSEISKPICWKPCSMLLPPAGITTGPELITIFTAQDKVKPPTPEDAGGSYGDLAAQRIFTLPNSIVYLIYRLV